MSSAQVKDNYNPYLAHMRSAPPPKADGYVDPFDGCIPRKVNATKAKEILVRPVSLIN